MIKSQMKQAFTVIISQIHFSVKQIEKKIERSTKEELSTYLCIATKR